jgi:Flp pilus assembly pilin Flp
MERDDGDVFILDEGGVAEGAAEVEYGLDLGGIAVIATTALKGIAAVLSVRALDDPGPEPWCLRKADH